MFQTIKKKVCTRLDVGRYIWRTGARENVGSASKQSLTDGEPRRFSTTGPSPTDNLAFTFSRLESCLGCGHSNTSHRNLLTSSTYARAPIGRRSSSRRDALRLATAQTARRRQKHRGIPSHGSSENEKKCIWVTTILTYNNVTILILMPHL